MEFPRQEYWSGFPFPTPEELPNPGIKLVSLAPPALAGGFLTTSATWGFNNFSERSESRMRPFWRLDSWHMECWSHLLQWRVCDRWRNRAQGIDMVGIRCWGACLAKDLNLWSTGYFAFSAEDWSFFYISVHDAYWLFHFFFYCYVTHHHNLTNNKSNSNHVLAQDSAVYAELVGDGSCWLLIVSGVFLSFLTASFQQLQGLLKPGLRNRRISLLPLSLGQTKPIPDSGGRERDSTLWKDKWHAHSSVGRIIGICL